MLYITSLVLTCLITGSLHLLTTFLQFPLPRHPIPTPASGNHKSDLFFFEFVCLFLNIIDLQYYVSSWYTT